VKEGLVQLDSTPATRASRHVIVAANTNSSTANEKTPVSDFDGRNQLDDRGNKDPSGGPKSRVPDRIKTYRREEIVKAEVPPGSTNRADRATSSSTKVCLDRARLT